MALLDLLFRSIDWVKHAYYDWSFSLLTGSTSETLLETITGQIIHFFFAAGLGILFIYLLNIINTNNYIFKGWLYGIAVWFSVHVIVNLFDFQPLKHIPLSQLFSDFITASIYGIILAQTIQYLNNINDKNI